VTDDDFTPDGAADFGDEDFSPEELAEAEALAHALDRGSAREHLPEGALETAALLRYAGDDGALDEARLDAILEDVLEEAKAAEREPARAKLAWWKWLLPTTLVGAGATAAALLLVPAKGGADLPEPSAALLQAQAKAAAGDGADLDAEMQTHRGAVFAALEARYR